LRRKKKRFQRLVFFTPLMVILVIVMLTLLSGFSTTGVLSVSAETSDRYYSAYPLFPSVTAASTTQRAPFNLTLAGGTYSVSFGSLPGFLTPPPRGVTVLPGKTAFAVGVYSPILKVVGVTSTGFNSTGVSAIHDVTPVVWVNGLSSYAVLEIDTVGSVVVPPSANYTHVFSHAGTYSYNLFNGNSTGYVAVA